MAASSTSYNNNNANSRWPFPISCIPCSPSDLLLTPRTTPRCHNTSLHPSTSSFLFSILMKLMTMKRTTTTTSTPSTQQPHHLLFPSSLMWLLPFLLCLVLPSCISHPLCPIAKRISPSYSQAHPLPGTPRARCLPNSPSISHVPSHPLSQPPSQSRRKNWRVDVTCPSLLPCPRLLTRASRKRLNEYRYSSHADMFNLLTQATLRPLSHQPTTNGLGVCDFYCVQAQQRDSILTSCSFVYEPSEETGLSFFISMKLRRVSAVSCTLRPLARRLSLDETAGALRDLVGAMC